MNPLLRQARSSGLLAAEKAMLAYTAATTVAILALWGRLAAPLSQLEARVGILVGMALLMGLYQLWPSALTTTLRRIFPLTLLGIWYPDTYEICQAFPNLDPAFAAADQALFGFQPALRFSQALPGKLWSELFHLGYFSYYPLIATTALLPLVVARREFGRTAFVVLAAFFMYYVIYCFLPVTGPQYYFKAIGTAAAQAGEFPDVGFYFRTHTEMLASPGPEGLFRSLVEGAQATGERPTAAFPSSHVGISTILMLLLWRIRRWAALLAFPFYALLVGATVYIQAHYFVDVVGGLVSAVAFFALAMWLYPRLEPKAFNANA